MDIEWIKTRMQRSGATIADIARLVERDRAAMSRILSGEQAFPLWMAEPVARKLGVSELELLSHAGVHGPEVTSAPLIPWHLAGSFAETSEEQDVSPDYLRYSIPGNSRTLFALKVEGEDMDCVAPRGSIIVCDYSMKRPQNRGLGVFSVGATTLFKRWHSDAMGDWLANDSWQPRYGRSVVETQPASIVTIGTVTTILQIA